MTGLVAQFTVQIAPMTPYFAAQRGDEAQRLVGVRVGFERG